MKTTLPSLLARLLLPAVLLFLPVTTQLRGLEIDIDENTNWTSRLWINTADSPYTFNIADGATLTFADFTFDNNGAAVRIDSGREFIIKPSGTGATGRAVFRDYQIPANRNGGAIYMYAGGKLDLTNVTFELTESFTPSTITQTGGAIYSDGGEVNLTNASFLNNKTSSQYGGGALYLKTANYRAKLSGTLIFTNNVGARGGAAVFDGGGAEFTEGSVAIFTSNTALWAAAREASGGAIYNSVGTLEFKGTSKFTGNTAENTNASQNALGGAIFSAGAGNTIFHQNTEFTQNSAIRATAVDKSGGGAIYINSNHGLLQFKADATFTGNYTTGRGGAIAYFNTAAANGAIFDGVTTFTSNTSGMTGGAIHTAGVLEINNKAEFTGNTSIAQGGAIFADTASRVFMTLAADAAGDITFSGNTANSNRNAIQFNNNASAAATLTIDTAAGRSVNFMDPISSYTGANKSITITKNGAGSLVFDTYHSSIKADTTINAGSLILTNNATFGATGAAGGTLIIKNGATLGGHGTINAVTTASNGSIITIGDATATAPGRLTFRNPLAIDGATLRFDLLGATGLDPAAHDQLIIAGNLNATALNTIDVTTVKTGSNTYNLIDVGAGNTITGAIGTNYALTINGITPTSRYAGSTITIAGRYLQLNSIASNLLVNWTGANALNPALWDDGITANTAAQTDANEKFFRDGDTIFFTDTAAHKTITIAPAGVTVSDMTVNNTAGNDYTFAGSGGITADAASAYGLAGTPAGKLTKQGAGALNFTNTGTNTFAGGIDLAQGTLGFTAASQIETTGTAITFTGDATLRANASNITLSNKLNAGAGRTATIDTGAHTLTYNGDLTGIAATATIAKTGAGTFKLDGNHAAYAATIRVDAGAFLLANNNTTLGGNLIAANAAATIGGAGTLSGAITLNNGNLQVGAGAPTDILTITGALAATADSRITFLLHDAQAAAHLDIAPGGTLTGIAPATIINFDFSHITANPSGTYTIGTNINSIASAQIYLNGVLYEAGSRQNAAFDTTTPGLLKLIYSTEQSRVMTWTGAEGDHLWNSDGSDNWTGSDGKTRYLAGDVANFTGAASNATIEIQGAAARASAININNTGTLTFTGLGITVASTYATGDEVTPALATGKLIKTGDGTLVFDNAANDFAGGIQIGDTGTAGGTVAFKRADQLGATVIFDGPGTLRPDEDGLILNNQLVFNPGALGALDIGYGRTLTIAGITMGAGTLVKTGAGTLILTRPGALGHAATAIDQGVVRLTDIYPTFLATSHTFTLNGGWLDLSDTAYVSDGSTANNWENFTFDSGANAAEGGIIGSNDSITLRDGDTAFAIGSPDSPEKRGLFVVIDADNDGTGGTATLTGTNHYIGYTRLDSGVLRVTANENLGDVATNREVILNGGTLSIAASFDSTRLLELRKTGAVSVDAGVATTWGHITKNTAGTVTFIKDGAGDLAISGSNAADALHVKAGRYIAQTLAGVGHGDVTADAGATVEVDASTAGSLANTFSGSGSLTLARGSLTLTGTSTIAIINASAGSTLTAGSVNALGDDLTTINLASNATLLLGVDAVRAGTLRMTAGSRAGFATNAGTTRTATLAGIGGEGVIQLNARLVDSQANHITITNPSTGSFGLYVINTGASPAGDTLGIHIPVVTIATGDAAFALTDANGAPVSGIDAGMFRYGLESAADGANTIYSLVYSGGFSSLGETINHMAGSMPLTWFTELDALHKRMGELRFDSSGDSGPQLWLRGHAQQFDFDADVTGAGFTERQYGFTVGLDYGNRHPSYNAYVGAFAGYGESNRDFQPRSDGKTTSLYAGGYFTLVTKNDWYADLTAKYNAFDNTFSMAYNTIPVSGDYTTYAIGGSVETGKRIALGTRGKWFLIPQAQLAATYLSAAAYATTLGNNVQLDSGWSLQGRAGAMFGCAHTDQQDAIFQPYVKLYLARQQTAGARLHADGGSWDPRIDGNRIEAGFGFNWIPTHSTQLYLDYEYAYGETYTKPYGINLGIRYLW